MKNYYNCTKVDLRLDFILFIVCLLASFFISCYFGIYKDVECYINYIPLAVLNLVAGIRLISAFHVLNELSIYRNKILTIYTQTLLNDEYDKEDLYHIFNLIELEKYDEAMHSELRKNINNDIDSSSECKNNDTNNNDVSESDYKIIKQIEVVTHDGLKIPNIPIMEVPMKLIKDFSCGFIEEFYECKNYRIDFPATNRNKIDKIIIVDIINKTSCVVLDNDDFINKIIDTDKVIIVPAYDSVTLEKEFIEITITEEMLKDIKYNMVCDNHEYKGNNYSIIFVGNKLIKIKNDKGIYYGYDNCKSFFNNVLN